MFEINVLTFNLITSIVLLFLLFIVYKFSKNKSTDYLLDKIPGPPQRYPFLGNLDLFWIKYLPLNQSFHTIITALSKVYEKYGIFKIKLGPRPVVVIFRQNRIKPLLSSNININKSDEYKLITDWVGNSLLTSNGVQWKNKRRLLTPAFHFKILEDFIPIMNEQSDILISNLRKAITKPFIDISEPLVECTLDIICETAMGVSIGAQFGKNQEYIRSLHSVGEKIIQRLLTPWLWPNFIFYKTSIGRQFKSDLNILHSMTRNVIKERKKIIISNKNQMNNRLLDEMNENNIYVSNKATKRMAFLDLLLDYHIENNSLSLEDIREEVDTFMFAGHDTTSSSLSWTLYLLGLHPETQIKIQEELDAIFGEETNRDITAEDLKQMNYLECVIKESLRLYPPAPFVARVLTEDIEYEDYVIPKGTIVYVLIHYLQKDPEYFSNPFHFKPQRFRDKTESNKNVYSYTPFSAGPRNCIGQKFALNEQKIILAKFFLNFNLKSLEPLDRIIVYQQFVTRSVLPLRVQIIPKHKSNQMLSHK